MKNLILVLFVCVAMLTSGCGLKFTPEVPYDNWEKGMFATAVGGQVLDYTSTKHGLSQGCVEANPIFGEDPNDAALVAAKVFASGAIWLGANAIENHKWRKIFLGVTSFVGLGAAVHNYNIDCN